MLPKWRNFANSGHTDLLSILPNDRQRLIHRRMPKVITNPSPITNHQSPITNRQSPIASGQSNKASKSVNYNSRVVLTSKLLIFTTLGT